MSDRRYLVTHGGKRATPIGSNTRMVVQRPKARPKPKPHAPARHARNCTCYACWTPPPFSEERERQLARDLERRGTEAANRGDMAEAKKWYGRRTLVEDMIELKLRERAHQEAEEVERTIRIRSIVTGDVGESVLDDDDNPGER